jgi:CheY-like chemotaxis protein
MAKILIIDDSLLNRRKLVSILSPDGHTIIEAANGQQGLEMIQTEAPDCILMDLLMPILDGYGLLKALRIDNNVIPIVVITADIQITSREMCMQLGAFCLLNKPPRAEEVLQAVKNALKGKG